jgi:hypothetical protein
MLRYILFSNWVFCFLSAFFIVIPKNGMTVSVLYKQGEAYMCSKIVKGRCYPCDGGKPIYIDPGIIKNFPHRTCPETTKGNSLQKKPKKEDTQNIPSPSTSKSK